MVNNLFIESISPDIILEVTNDKIFRVEDVNTGASVNLDKQAVFAIINKARQFLVESR